MACSVFFQHYFDSNDHVVMGNYGFVFVVVSALYKPMRR